MFQIETETSKICIDSIFCVKENCQNNHSRFYLGICLEYLRMEEEWYKNQDEDFEKKKCDIQECKLQHLDQSKLKSSLQQSINGIFLHNLCCKNECDCKLIHKPWANNICINDIMNVCQKKKKNNCSLNHLTWNQLKQKANESSKINFTTPEQLCESQNCNCQQHYPWMTDQKICIPFLQGFCPYIKCLKNHVEWEGLSPKQKIEQNSLQPCSIIYQELKQKANSFSQKQSIQLQCEEAKFLKFKESIFQSNIIDVVFIMDLTGSMQTWKIQMENAIDEIIQQFQKTNKGHQIRFGFVGYRDECDKNEKITYINLTQKVDEFKKQISKLEAKGGGDTAEDVVAGFEKALELNFSLHEESLLCTFLIADAPCHGREYHDISSDNQIDSVEKNYLENVLKKYKKIKECNFLCCIKINETTNKMFQKMQQVFPLLTITSQKQPKEISDQVLFTLKQSLIQSKSIQSKIKNTIQIQAQFNKYKLNISPPNYQYNNRAKYWQNFYNVVDQSLRKGGTALDIEQHINESLQSDDQNCSTYIFKAFDTINNMYIAIKIPKFIIDMYREGKLDKKSIDKAEQLAKTRFYSSSYACQMAHYFNQKISKIQEIPSLFYVLPIIYTLTEPFFGMNTVYGETFINIQHQFKKYTTNSHHSEPKYYYYSVFSHFSFIESGHTLVITDLQGCDNILSDPSIQTKKGLISILDFDETNHNEKGIEIFLTTQHQECSYYCSLLQLSREQFKITNSQKLDQTKWQIAQKTNIYGICITCSLFTQYDFDAQKQQQEKGYIMNCQICKTESNKQMSLDQHCNCCFDIYSASLNISLRNQTETGRCDDCKQLCSDLNQQCCYYCESYCLKNQKEMRVNEQLIRICSKGQAYLCQQKCAKCQKLYNNDVILSKDQYNKGIYKCIKCAKD
ncbi:unnamed protein product [Paramecium primaurelia]|uniref:Alpha-type protein kinase domain-containing protein n=1 Tax=Paramecium primaurelia TaxID=5886 RepID=A0A8S1K930_PARPR|nr:unnamed protein product [Paramecium primaurelia]